MRLNDLVMAGPGRSGQVFGKTEAACNAVAPHADHLRQWLNDEAARHHHTDQEWINEVLKEALADQRPDISMAWLDQQLPSNQERYDDE